MARQLSPDFAASAARTTSGNSAGVTLPAEAEYLSILVAVTAVSGTSPSAAFTVEWSNDGTTWAQGDPADSFTAITAVGNKAKVFQVKGEMARLVWAITGTTPSFTFAATAVTAGARAFA